MYLVITVDQRESRKSELRVAEWVRKLNAEYGGRMDRDFGITVGDEFQGLTRDPSLVNDLVLENVRTRDWWVGVGIGGVSVLEKDISHSVGPSFYSAREAVDLAKRSKYGFAVEGPNRRVCGEIEDALSLTSFIVSGRARGERAEKTNRAMLLKEAGRSNTEIGKRLGISAQAVGQRLRSAGYEEEVAGRRLSASLITRALEDESA